MVVFIKKCRLGLCVVALSSVLNIADAPGFEAFDQRVLAAQNLPREQLGLHPLLWNSGLAAAAQISANRLAAAHIFEHAPENTASPQGENLWGGTRGYYTPEDMVNAWVDEKKYFKPGIFPDISTTGNVEDVGHFTQVIWKNTKEVGCAVVHDADYDYLVCRYSPAGNYVGERPY